jgi:hypothetical protein
MARITLSESEIRRYYETHIPNLKKSGKELRGACSLHGGKRGSLAINLETGAWFCHSEGRGGSIFDFEAEVSGTSGREARAAVLNIVGRSSEPERHIADAYDYTDEDGALLYQTVRYTPKDFRQRRPDGRGGWIWNLKNVRLVLYKLPNVLAAPIAFVCEGEKDADALAELGVVATTSPMGAGKWRSEYSEFLRGKQVYVIPDADEKGRQHAGNVMRSLQGVAGSAKLIQLPGAKDASEWIGKGGTLEALIALAEREDSNPGPRVNSVEGAASPWPEPEPLQGELPPVAQFDPVLLPESLRPMAVDITERMGVPPDFVGALVVLCLAGAVNRRAMIQPKAVDTSWVVVPNLWGGVVAESGLKKSPTLKAVASPLEKLQALWHQEYASALDNYAQEKEEQELRRAAWRDQYKHAQKHPSSPAPIRPDETLREPKFRRLILNDATYEKTHEAMQQNPAGVFIVRDELTGWLAQLDRQGREGEREFALQAWNGDTGHAIDRIGRGTVYVPHCCMSLMGGIQPDRLRSYLVATLAGGPTNDGLVQRLQVLVWPDISRNPAYVDRVPNATAAQQVARIFSRLVNMDPETAERFQFAGDAQELFVAWFWDLERRLASNELHAALASHLSKYRSLMPSLALLFELADAAAGERESTCVSLAHARQAAEWCDYLESHARRIYSCVVTPQFRSAQTLSEKIKEKKVGADAVFAIRDVYLKGWTGLDTPETAQAAAEILADAGWVRALESESPDPLRRGRPANRYRINPKVWAS